MKCCNCSFSLLCYMNRFEFRPITVEGGILSFIFLCPTCGRLIYTYAKSTTCTVYTFFCEKRKKTKQMSDWIKSSSFISASVVDPVTGQSLWIINCTKCALNKNFTPILSASYDRWIALE